MFLTSEALEGRVFGLDMQFVADAVILALSIFILFLALSYFLFNPARALLKKRQEKIREDMELGQKEKADGIAFKAEYDAKLQNADKEIDQLLSDARKKALKRETEIIEEAKKEAVLIKDRADKEIELEKKKAQDEVKQEMISVASMMAGKIIGGTIDDAKRDELVDEALNEMGDDTWRN